MTWAEENEWHWVRVAPPGPNDDWDVLQGTANLIFDGAKFSTTLRYHTDNVWRDFLVSGVIGDDNAVAAMEVRLETDANVLAYHGTIQRDRTPVSAASQGWGSDRIVLSSGPYFIGLFRKVGPTE